MCNIFVGNFTLKPEYKCFKVDKAALDLKECLSPEEIIEYINSKMMSQDEPESTQDEQEPTQDEQEPTQDELRSDIDIDDLISTGLAEMFDPEITSTQKENAELSGFSPENSNVLNSILSIVTSLNTIERKDESRNKTILNANFMRAENLADTVEYLKNKDRYVVSSGRKGAYLVNLNDMTCTCMARKQCVHVMAVQLNIGYFTY